MKTILVALSILILSAVPAAAQTYLTTTTTGSAVTATATQIVLASGTNVQADGALYIDQEYIPIVSCAVAACTTVNVRRVTRPAAHASGQQVFVATRALKAQTMLVHSAAFRVGVCSTSTSGLRATALAGLGALPIIDIDEAIVYDCRRNGTGGAWVWNAINLYQIGTLAASTWAQ